MHVDESLPSHIRKSVCRRTLFVIALLGTGSAVSFLTGAYSYDRGHPFGMFGDHSWGTKSFFLSLDRQVTGFSGFWITSMFPLPLDRYCNAFIWGIDFSLVAVLGAWLILRYGWWETWFGRFRATIYTSAFFYGSILTTATQRWINDLAPNGYPRDANGPAGLYANYTLVFHFPGTQINSYFNDYSRPATDVLILLAVIWILVPVVIIFNIQLGSKFQAGSFSIGTVLSWTALSALILAYINFLCQWYSPDTGFSSLPLVQAVAEFIFELLPATATSIFAIVMFAKAPKGSWKTMVIGAIAILVLDTFGDRVIFRAIDYIGLFPRRASPLAGPDRWAFQTGRIVGVWTAMSVAARLGVSFVSSLKKQPETNEGLDTASLF